MGRIYTRADNDGRNIFTFGSNQLGIHGAGAALAARLDWGAQPGVGEGRTGMAYAIPTKITPHQRRNLNDIAISVRRFNEYAVARPGYRFLLTTVGTGHAGYTHEQVAPLFQGLPRNVILPDEWVPLLTRKQTLRDFF